MNEEKKVWGIHTMNDNLFLNKGVIAIGRSEVGDLSKIEPTCDAFKAKIISAYPNAKKGANLTFYKIVPGTRTKKQTIAIIWNFIGAFDIPEEARKTA